GFFLYQRRALLSPRVYRIMQMGIVLSIGAELAFTFYVDVYDPSNLIGHIFKFFSFWLVYEAVIHTTLHEPFTVLARNVTTRTKELQAKIVELEQTRDQLVSSEKMASLGRRDRRRPRKK
ncbi:MAG: hypothetical protein D3906_16410, partial [Candidatus Electrothrix sp. AUS1_2]|nr:hypothetical protein [Candidatus Electrothrix sp. AUS1_2]